MASIKLSKISTRAPKGLDKDKIKNITKGYLDEIENLQNLLYAENKHSILVIIQGMDASGKDGLTKDVFTSINPQGIQVKSWKAPTPEELSHDFLWRIHQHTPAKGMIQLHNRSHYEDILITRVHNWIDNATAKRRMKSINDFESHLRENNNTTILKFYLHISHEEQVARLQERMSIPEKMWKYNENDLKESELWDTYMKYYEEAFANCNDPEWTIVPSDQNWYKNYVVAERLLQTMKDFKMKFPGIKKS
jgi:PPK2 family polyphosphate:nucleotide phosphotransferase